MRINFLDRRHPTITVFLVTVFLLISPMALAEHTTSETVYHGDSLTELINGLPNRYLGLCEASFDYQMGSTYSRDPNDNTKCIVTMSATATYSTNINMPAWAEYGEASAEEKACWDLFHGNLQTHEDGHKAIYDQANEAIQNISVPPQTVPCADAAATANAMMDSYQAQYDTIYSAANDASAAYDTNTNHGETQGATLRFPCGDDDDDEAEESSLNPDDIDEWSVIEEVHAIIEETSQTLETATEAEIDLANLNPEDPSYEIVQEQATASMEAADETIKQKERLWQRIKKFYKGNPFLTDVLEVVQHHETVYWPNWKRFVTHRKKFNDCSQIYGENAPTCRSAKNHFDQISMEIDQISGAFDQAWNNKVSEGLADYVPPGKTSINTVQPTVQPASYLTKQSHVPIKNQQTPFIINLNPGDARLIRSIQATVNDQQAESFLRPQQNVLLVKCKTPQPDGEVTINLDIEDKFNRHAHLNLTALKGAETAKITIVQKPGRFDVSIHNKMGFNSITVTGTGITPRLPNNPYQFEQPVTDYKFKVGRRPNAKINVSVGQQRKNIDVNKFFIGGTVFPVLANGAILFDVMKAPALCKDNQKADDAAIAACKKKVDAWLKSELAKEALKHQKALEKIERARQKDLTKLAQWRNQQEKNISDWYQRELNRLEARGLDKNSAYYKNKRRALDAEHQRRKDALKNQYEAHKAKIEAKHAAKKAKEVTRHEKAVKALEKRAVAKKKQCEKKCAGPYSSP